MPQEVTDIDVLRDYLQGVVGRADDHAQTVNEVCLSIAGGVVWRKDNQPVEVMAIEGEMKNVLWFRVGGQRYALSYNHETREIQLRRGTTHGDVVASFSNATSNGEVRNIFARL